MTQIANFNEWTNEKTILKISAVFMLALLLMIRKQV
jgi:hypothetical protein